MSGLFGNNYGGNNFGWDNLPPGFDMEFFMKVLWHFRMGTLDELNEEGVEVEVRDGAIHINRNVYTNDNDNGNGNRNRIGNGNGNGNRIGNGGGNGQKLLKAKQPEKDKANFKILSRSIYFTEDEPFNELILKSLRGPSRTVVDAAYYLCKDKFNYANDSLYEFKDHRWHRQHTIIRNLDFIHDKYKEIKDWIKNSSLFSDDRPELYDFIRDFYKKLKDERMTKAVTHGLMKRFMDNSIKIKFQEKLDRVPNLICFNNGTYDLDKMEFRDGRPEDYISMCTGYDYKAEYSEHKDRMMSFLKDVFPCAEDMHYVLKYIASGLSSRRKEELFTVFIGNGRNGKSRFMDIVDNVFGDYMSRTGYSLVNSDMPQPEDVKKLPPQYTNYLNNRKIIVSPEGESKLQMNGNFLKYMIGNNKVAFKKHLPQQKISTKKLPPVPKEIKERPNVFNTNFMWIMVCNYIPKVDLVDDDLLSKFRVVTFPSEFIDFPNPKFKNQKKVNVKIMDELKNWTNDFLLLLLEYYKLYQEEGLTMSRNIAIWSERYGKELDVFPAFLSRNVIKCKKEDYLLCDEIYDRFKTWMKKEYGGCKINYADFLKGLDRHKEVRDLCLGKDLLQIIEHHKLR